VHKKNLKFL